MFSKQQKNITNHYHNVFHSTIEIDYNKLAKAIVKAQQDAEAKKEIEKQQTEEKRKKEIIQNRFKNLGCAKYFDEEGNPKNRKAKFKLVWGVIKAKESALKDVSIIDLSINSIVSLFFAAIEWLLYLIAIGLIGFGIYNIVQFVSTCIIGDVSFSYLTSAFDYILYAILSFLFSKMIIRMLKIDCKYNQDRHYMMNFLAVIIAIIALIVSIIKK